MSDNISRQAALDAVSYETFECYEARKAIRALPSADPKRDDENEIKFFYVESIDDYWIGGVRIGNFYYATWHGRFGFIWSHSKYLPWGEHIVDENTLWKEHTYPSEPKEMPFTEWIRGFVKKYFTGADMRGERDEKQGEGSSQQSGGHSRRSADEDVRTALQAPGDGDE